MSVSIPADGARSRFVLWLAHQAAWVWAAIVVLLMFAFLTRSVPDVSQVPFFSAIVAAIAVTRAEIHHARVMCPRCAAAVPLDGARQAQDRAVTLRWTHRLCPGYSRLPLPIVLALTAMVVVAMLPAVPLLVDAIVSVLGCAVTSVDAYLVRVHDPLQPWCPHCHWDDGGDTDNADVPDPVPPSGVAVRS
jgi:hypothetical protein